MRTTTSIAISLPITILLLAGQALDIDLSRLSAIYLSAESSWRERRAAEAILEKLGVRYYSAGRYRPPKVVFTPPASRTRDDFSEASKPFFDYRGMTRAAQPWTLGVSQADVNVPREHTADHEIFTRKATRERGERNGMVSSHPAVYLVPQGMYYDDHPEYYGMDNDGDRSRGDLWYGVTLNMGHPDVRRISADRMLERMNSQNDRRFFMAVAGDAEPGQGRENRALDYDPPYVTDRNLTWVNAMARAGQEHPERRRRRGRGVRRGTGGPDQGSCPVRQGHSRRHSFTAAGVRCRQAAWIPFMDTSRLVSAFEDSR